MRVRVSVANLINKAIAPIGEGDFCSYVGIFASSAYKKGEKRYQPIGGAAELTELGRNYLATTYGAENFHKSEEGGIDARFEVDDSRLAEVFVFFLNRDSRCFEIDPRRELIEELSTVELTGVGGLPVIPPILTHEEAESIEVEYSRPVIQPFKDDVGTSGLARKGLPSRRLFFHFNLLVSREIFKKMKSSDAIRFLDFEEMDTTEGGLHKGVTKDGIELADNFIP